MTKEQKQFIKLFPITVGRSYDDWAQEFCVTKTTICRWVKKYRNEIETRRKEFLDDVATDCKQMLTNFSKEAVTRLIELVHSDNDNVSLNAALRIIDMIGINDFNAITDSDFQIVVNIPESIRKTQNNNAD